MGSFLLSDYHDMCAQTYITPNNSYKRCKGLHIQCTMHVCQQSCFTSSEIYIRAEKEKIRFIVKSSCTSQLFILSIMNALVLGYLIQIVHMLPLCDFCLVE